jgi:hypothetical protein
MVGPCVLLAMVMSAVVGGAVGGGDAHTHTAGQRIVFGVVSASLPKSAYVQSEQGKPLAVDW